jgi:hypothetical protein
MRSITSTEGVVGINYQYKFFCNQQDVNDFLELSAHAISQKMTDALLNRLLAIQHAMAMSSANNEIVSLEKTVRCVVDTFTDDRMSLRRVRGRPSEQKPTIVATKQIAKHGEANK